MQAGGGSSCRNGCRCPVPEQVGGRRDSAPGPPGRGEQAAPLYPGPGGKVGPARTRLVLRVRLSLGAARSERSAGPAQRCRYIRGNVATPLESTGRCGRSEPRWRLPAGTGGRPAWVLEEGRGGGGGRRFAISPCPWHRRENGRFAPAASGEEPVAIAAFARPRCPRLGAALSVRGASGRSSVSRVSGPPCAQLPGWREAREGRGGTGLPGFLRVGRAGAGRL